MGRRAKHADIETMPMFEVEGITTTAVEKEVAAKSVAQGWCPSCPRERKTGIVRVNGHLYWRAHTVPLISGKKRPCSSGNVPLHQLAARPEYRGDTTMPICSCQRPSIGIK